MDEFTIRMLTVIYPTVIVCGSAVFGYWLKLRHQRKMAREDQHDLDVITSDLDLLRQQYEQDIATIQERLDFTERLLTQQRQPRLDEVDTPTPV
jgi:hypothetical protein